MPVIKEQQTWTPGASAVTKDFELAKRPLHAVTLQWDMLGAGAAATQANALTQCGTKIYIKDARGDVTPQWSMAELLQYQELFTGKNVPFQDGTAADNKLALNPITLFMGRPNKNAGYPLEALDPYVGYNPKGTPFLHVEVPDDGNSIDNRHLKIVPIYADQPFQYDKRWTPWTAQTVSTTGLTDWIVGDRGLWCEWFMHETSSYNDTLTSDAPSVLDIEIERGGKDVLFDGAVPNILGSFLDDDTHADDDYKYMNLSQAPFNDFRNCINLFAETKVRVLGGVADAVTMAFSVLNGTD